MSMNSGIQFQEITHYFKSYPEAAVEAVNCLKADFETTRAQNTPSIKVKICCVFQDRVYCGVKIDRQQIDCIFDHAAPVGYYKYFRGSVVNDYCEVKLCTSTISDSEMGRFEDLMKAPNIGLPVVVKEYSYAFFTHVYQGTKVKIPMALRSYFTSPSAPAIALNPVSNVQVETAPKKAEEKRSERSAEDEAGLVLQFAGPIRQVGVQHKDGKTQYNVCEMTPVDAKTAEWLSKKG